MCIYVRARACVYCVCACVVFVRVCVCHRAWYFILFQQDEASCLIEDVCYGAGERNPNNCCQTCNPTISDTIFTNITGMVLCISYSNPPPTHIFVNNRKKTLT